jgi:hypothetical protein
MAPPETIDPTHPRPATRMTTRLVHAWRELEPEQRLAAIAALGLFVSMFLPWYSKTNTFVEHNAAKATQTSLSAFEAFSFVEAAVLLVSAGVLAMLFARVERHPFRLPGGDGTIVMIAGGWTALLIFYRLLDKPSLQGTQQITATVGVEWGIFIALLLALGLVYAGGRIRAAERPEPPLARARERPKAPDPDAETHGAHRQQPSPDEEATRLSPEPERPTRSTPVPARGRPRYPPTPSEQMSFEDPPPEPD